MRAASGNSGKLPVAVLIAVALVLVVGAGAFTYSRIAKTGKGAEKAAPEVELVPWKLEEFVVNLADRTEARYLKVNMVLEVMGKAGGGEGASNPEEAKARDAVITVLTRKSYSQLVSPDGKERLKKELKTALNLTLIKAKVENIYFTSFAMQ